MSKVIVKNNRIVLDWEAIEAEYRAGSKSQRTIAAEYGCSDAAIRQKAKKEGWVRDLSEKIRLRTEAIELVSLARDEQVSRMVQGEKYRIEVAAERQAAVLIKENSEINRMVRVFDAQSAALEELISDLDSFKQLGALLRNPDKYGNDKLNDIYNKAISIPSQVDTFRRHVETADRLMYLRRRNMRIVDKTDDNGASVESVETTLRAARLRAATRRELSATPT
jgi:hypothetical protein